MNNLVGCVCPAAPAKKKEAVSSEEVKKPVKKPAENDMEDAILEVMAELF